MSCDIVKSSSKPYIFVHCHISFIHKSISGTVPVYYALPFFIQEVVEQEQIEKHELQHQLREIESMLNRTKDAWNMEQETRKLEQLQYQRMMERVTMKSYMYMCRLMIPILIYMCRRS